MWAAVYSVEIQDGRLPELKVGDDVTTDLAIRVEDKSPLLLIDRPVQSITQVLDTGSTALDTAYDIEGRVVPFAGKPNLWLVDTGEVSLLPVALDLIPRPTSDWVGLRGAVSVSEYGYHASPGYRTWTVRRIVLQRRSRGDQDLVEIVETDITAMNKWSDAKKGFQSRYLLDLTW
jgi:hypothetical protein